MSGDSTGDQLDVNCATVAGFIGCEVAQDLSDSAIMLASRARALGELFKSSETIPDDLYDDTAELAAAVGELFDTLTEAYTVMERSNCGC